MVSLGYAEMLSMTGLVAAVMAPGPAPLIAVAVFLGVLG